jgi:ribosome biogenesis GTPase A
MIQWYPGHMAKTRRLLIDDLKLIDLVIEVLDARIPQSSKIPDLDRLINQRERIIALNKIDLADRTLTGSWQDYYQEDFPTVGINSKKGTGIRELLALIGKKSRLINQNMQKKGRLARDIRIMVVGIPNVGKSALINIIAGTGITKTGDKPGVTRGKQWIKIDENIQLLDTPGILWPRIDDEDTGYKLALTGAISDDIFDQELAAFKLITYLLEIDKTRLERYYGIETAGLKTDEILSLIGRKRGCLMSGDKIDPVRASKILINDFRKARLGPVTLEKPGGG